MIGQGWVALNWKKVSLIGYYEEIVCCEGDEARAQLSREVVDSSSLEVFKTSWMGLWATYKVSLATAGGWNEMIFEIPSNSNHFMILLFYDDLETIHKY